MTKKRIPEFHLEQYVLGELPETKATGYVADGVSGELCHLAEGVRESDQQILEKYPPQLMAAKIRDKIDKRGVAQFRTRDFIKSRGIALAAAAAILVLAGVLPILIKGMETGAGDGNGIRVKGLEPGIFVYRKLDDGVERLMDGDLARENDLLQLSYIAAEMKYGMILSIDGRGAVTLHYPDQLDASSALNGSGEVALNFSYRLDDAPRFERFFFVAGSESLPADTVLNAARSLASSQNGGQIGGLVLPKKIVQSSITLMKEGAR